MSTDSIAQTVSKLKALRDEYLNALLSDAVSPRGIQTDYSLEGRTVSRNSWRSHLTDEITKINQLLTQYQPFESTSVMM